MAERKQCTLLIKNLPCGLSDEAVETLVKHYGALSVRIMGKHGKMTGCVFADFIDQQVAKEAQEKLNKVVLGKNKLQAVEATVSHADVTVNPPPLTPAIAPALGLNYPFSPLLEYKYPKATQDIVLNISNAMMVVPRFYTQVLHLMNKMNLPAPFEPETIKGPFSTLSSTETMVEEAKTEEERDVDEPIEEVIPFQMVKRKAVTCTTRGGKKPKRLGQSIFSDPNETLPKGLATRPSVISDQELERRRVKDTSEYKVLENYSPGTPTSELYVKNIAKTVDESDLMFVFGAVFDSDKKMNESLEIQLFTSGRMRGQAFLKFPTVELAKKALEKTNAVLMDEKPIVVVRIFAYYQPRSITTHVDV